MEVLFTLLAERYERGSVMITSNLPFSKWESIFKDPMTTAAAIDRLVHHSVILGTQRPELPLGAGQTGSAARPVSNVGCNLVKCCEQRSRHVINGRVNRPGSWGIVIVVGSESRHDMPAKKGV